MRKKAMFLAHNTAMLLAVGIALLPTACKVVQPEKCTTMPYLANSLAKNPERARIFRENEALILRAQKEAQSLSNNLIIIPVVVHVVWNTSDQNISDAQALSQINVLNEDYRKMTGTNGGNNNPIGADTKLEFRLAQVDPGGNPTNGIERTQTKVTAFTDAGPDADAVKFTSKGGADAWDASKYLNLWVCALVSKPPYDLLGYATFPGEPVDVDGVVINYKAFGDNVGTSINPPANLGRTTTHEVGHWLNLWHTFQDGCPNTNCLEQGDKVCDTPPVATPTSGCPQGRASCGIATLINDYMDYSSDACMNLFTDGQNYRIRTTMDAIRSSLKMSSALTNSNFTLFGTHTGTYNYFLNGNFIINGAGVFTPFAVPSGSSVTINSQGNNPVAFGQNIKVEEGAVFIVRQTP